MKIILSCLMSVLFLFTSIQVQADDEALQVLSLSAEDIEPLSDGAGPLPKFELKGVTLHWDDLQYNKKNDLIHPSIIKTKGRIKNPLGKYYLYYSPHKHKGVNLAYSDSLKGPWKEYEGNPLIKGVAAPDIRWIEESGKFFMWAHGINYHTDMWTTKDGVKFKKHSIAVHRNKVGTNNATYTRVYNYPIEQYDSKYIMLYSGVNTGDRAIWMAHSKDAKDWTQLTTPIVNAAPGEHKQIYGPSFLRYKQQNYIVYQDNTSNNSGGNIKYVSVNENFDPVGKGGQRYVLLNPPSSAPYNNRLRGAEFYQKGNKLHMISGASGKYNEVLVRATAKLD